MCTVHAACSNAGRRTQKKVASRSPGTCSESLWLLPSGPDQIHDAAMRGDPPLIGRANVREDGIIGHRPPHGKRAVEARIASAHGGYNPSHRRYATAFRLIAVDPTVRPSHQIFLAIAAIFIAVALVPALMPAVVPALFPVADDGPPPLLPPAEANELVVMIRPGPVVYFPGPDGTLVGFDADLARRFAAETEAARALRRRRIVGADDRRHRSRPGAHRRRRTASATRRPAPARSRKSSPCSARGCRSGPDGVSAAKVLWSAGYYAVEPQLIYNSRQLQAGELARSRRRNGRLPRRHRPRPGYRRACGRPSGRRVSMGSTCPRRRGSLPRFPTAPSATRSSVRSPHPSRATSTSITRSRSPPGPGVRWHGSSRPGFRRSWPISIAFLRG